MLSSSRVSAVKLEIAVSRFKISLFSSAGASINEIKNNGINNCTIFSKEHKTMLMVKGLQRHLHGTPAEEAPGVLYDRKGIEKIHTE